MQSHATNATKTLRLTRMARRVSQQGSRLGAQTRIRLKRRENVAPMWPADTQNCAEEVNPTIASILDVQQSNQVVEILRRRSRGKSNR
jgi:hypothetical protein